MIDLNQLTLDSTLGDLPSHDFQVTATTSGGVVAEKFRQQPDLPGVIIIHEAQMLGMISRTKFREQMSSPERIELYSNCPIRVLLDFIRIPPLLLAENWRIDEAAYTALKRQKDLVYEPIIVVLDDRSLHLLDVHTLLLAQSQILGQANKIIRQQKVQVQQTLEALDKEQEKVKEYTLLLESKQRQTLKPNSPLEPEQVELLKQAQEIAQLNQQFIRVGQLISVEFRKAFQSTLIGVTSICNNSDRTLDIGRAIAKDVETIHRASKTFGEIIQQVRHLAVQAAVVANQMNGQGNGLGQVSSEMSRLTSQTFEVGHQVEQIASRFKHHLQELSATARGGANVARAVSQKIERAEMALLELEEIVGNKDPNSIPIIQEKVRDVDLVTSQSFSQEIQRAAAAAEALKKLRQNPESIDLIQKIDQTLKHRPKNFLEKP
ncbi:MAG: chemotaxis protein [Actinomycetota bacterium]